MQDFKCITNNMSTIRTTFQSFQTTLDETLTQAKEIQAILTDSNNWAGEAQLVGTAFFDLVVQYHEQLAGSEDGPAYQAEQAILSYLQNNSHFYLDWAEYDMLKQI